ncbi:MAG: hypothetical protein QM808_18060 [Steroidobacteraceae bacterium]
MDEKVDQMAAHKLMFALIQQLNTIVLIQRDFIFKELNNPARFLSIQPSPQFDLKKSVLESSDLTFLLHTRESRSIAYEFYVAQESYIAALHQWNLRSNVHLEKVQPALASAGINTGMLISESDLHNALGTFVHGSIISATDNCISILRHAFQQLMQVKAKARPYVVKRFRSNDFTDFDFQNTYGLDDKK